MPLRTAIIDAQKALYRNGSLVSLGVPRGLGLAHCPIVDRGELLEQRALKVSDVIPPQPKVRPPKIEVWLNKTLIKLTWQAGEFCSLGTRFFAGSQGVEAYCQSYGERVFRISLRVLVDKVISDLRIFVYGQDTKVEVEYAAERYPCLVTLTPQVGTLITLADGKTPGTDNLEELGWMLGGVIDTTLPAGSAEQYASEVDAEVQYRHKPGPLSLIWRSIDFVVQPIDSDEQYGPPLVLERGKWAPLFDGSVETKEQVEGELEKFYRQRIYQRSGWATYGDWPHVPGQKSRCRMNGHYFHCTALLRALVRAECPVEWHKKAQVAFTYVRDMCWMSGHGLQSHGKGLTPWSGPFSTNGHWVDSEALAMAYLVLGDTFAKRTYDEWLAKFTMPTLPGRESAVAKRMCDVAFIMTGQTVWRERADELQTKLLADIEAGVQLTGPLWHPEWCDKVILKDQQRVEYWINAKAYPILNAWRPQQREADGSLIPDNVGPTGEGGLLLLMHRLRTGERIYGSNQCDNRRAEPISTRIWVEKKDDKPLELHIRLGRRIKGDIHPTSLRVYDPTSKCVFECADIRKPYLAASEDAAGFPILEGELEIPGPRGKWRVDLSSHALACYVPVSDWEEKQEGSGWKFPAYE